MTTTSSVLLPPGGQRILVIMAHPDDAEFICGGTMARLAAEGHTWPEDSQHILALEPGGPLRLSGQPK
jgi:hypothetical protein